MVCDTALPTGTGLGLEPVAEVDNVEEASACAVADKGTGDGDRQMRLAGACPADQDDIALIGDERAGGEIADQGSLTGGLASEKYTDDHANPLAGHHRVGDSKQLHQPIDAGRGARAGEYHRMVSRRVATGADDRARFPAGPRHQTSTIGRFGVTVGIVRKHVLEHEAFDLVKGAARGDIVGIDHPPLVVRAQDRRVGANEPFAQICEEGHRPAARHEISKTGFHLSGCLTCRVHGPAEA